MRRWLAVALVLPAIVSAHGIVHPRRISLRASSGLSVEVDFELMLDRAESDEARRLFDRDRDGRLSDVERSMLATYLSRRAVGGFAMTCEQRPVAFRLAAPLVQDGGEHAELSVKVSGKADLASASCVVEDGGDAEGHVPLAVSGADVETDAPRGVSAVAGTWDLPAHAEVRLHLVPRPAQR